MQKNLTHNRLTKIISQDYSWLKSINLPWEKLSGQKILITGANGFIASNLICFLAKLNFEFNFGIKVVGMVRDVKKAMAKFENIGLDFHFLELVDNNIFESPNLKPDFTMIFHAAGVASPKFFQSNPIEVALPNTLGTFKLLEYSEKCSKLELFMFFSTTGVNGFVDDKSRPVSETTYGGLDPTNIANSYLISKTMGESFCHSWAVQKGIPVKIVRPGITYGPGFELNDGRSYADFVRNILNNENIVLHSSGKAVRNFCYIADFLSGMFHVIFHGKPQGTYNICSEREISIESLANFLVNDVFPEKNLSVVFDLKTSQYLRINFIKTTVSNAELRSLGWNEFFTLHEGMKRTVNSFLE